MTNDVRNPADTQTPEEYEFLPPFNRYLVRIPGLLYIECTGDTPEEAMAEAEHFVEEYSPHPFTFALPGSRGREVQVCMMGSEPEIEEELCEDQSWKIKNFIQIPPEPVPDIDDFVRMLKEAAGEWPMTMGWIDTVSKGRRLGRGILYRGRWATPQEAPARPAKPVAKQLTVPFMLPSWTLNGLTVRAFNELVYRKPTHGLKPVHWEGFFYPLDKVRHWNRGYGRKGFTQYQCVLPHAVTLSRLFGARITLLRVLETLRPSNRNSYVDPLDWHIRKAEATAYLQDASARLGELGIETKTALLEGQPAGQIIEYAHSQDVSLILLASHGRSCLSGWNISSVV